MSRLQSLALWSRSLASCSQSFTCSQTPKPAKPRKPAKNSEGTHDASNPGSKKQVFLVPSHQWQKSNLVGRAPLPKRRATWFKLVTSVFVGEPLDPTNQIALGSHCLHLAGIRNARAPYKYTHRSLNLASSHMSPHSPLFHNSNSSTSKESVT